MSGGKHYTTPVRYVLYSHYGKDDGSDRRAYVESGKDRSCIPDLPGVKYLVSHFRGLRELLTAPGHEGALVLFYAPGYREFLDGEARGRDPDALLQGEPALQFARDVQDHVRQELDRAQLADRVRFITPLDFHVMLGRVNAKFADKFTSLLVGDAEGTRYDVPKVPEAVLRLRMLGSGVPVLRLDHDVIFRGDNALLGDLHLFKAVACAMRAYDRRLSETSISTFLFSASYNDRPLLYPEVEPIRFVAWGRAFATRVYPSLIADRTAMLEAKRLTEEQDAGTTAGTGQQHTSPVAGAGGEDTTPWEAYVVAHLDEALACRFYGLVPADGTPVAGPATPLRVDGVSGLTSIGAHPLHAVISGALLCLSEGAILDLPPFSNMSQNVMWIDDHLKYALHRAMDHFTSGESERLEPGLRDARMDGVAVTKGRSPIGANLVEYVFNSYLPTLLWGTVLDAWICQYPILKCRRDSLTSQEDRDAWARADASPDKAPLPRRLLEALHTGSFSELGGQAQEFRSELVDTAVKRISEVQRLWSALVTTDGRPSFASLWATGTVEKTLGPDWFTSRECSQGLWRGIPAVAEGPSAAATDLAAGLQVALARLVEDAVHYVQWTLEWPTFVQIVRSVPHGEFAGDLGWRPSPEPTPPEAPGGSCV